MIISLFGEDDFCSLQKLRQIIARYQKTHTTGLNLRFFDCQAQDFEDFRDEFRTKSMFKEKKLFVLKNAFLSSDFKQKFLKAKQQFLKSENIIVFYEKGDVPSKDPLFLFFKKNSRYQKFSPLSDKELESWIEKQIKSSKAQIEPQATKLLIRWIGNNLWQLSNEIQKLINYKQGSKKIIIKKQDVQALTPPKIEANIFKTIDFIAEKQTKKALYLLHAHLKKGDSPFYLLSMINYQFRNILALKDVYQSATNVHAKIKELNLHPFVVKKTSYLCRKFTLEELKNIYQKIFETDLAIKTGQIEPELALDLLIAQI